MSKKIVFIGAGSHRYLSVASSIMAEKAILHDDELNLHDLDVEQIRIVADIVDKYNTRFDKEPVT